MASTHLQRELEARISDYFHSHLIPAARNVVSARKSEAEDALAKGQTRDLMSDAEDVRAGQGSEVDAIAAMVRQELGDVRKEIHNKLEVLQESLRRDMDALRHESHAREALARNDVIRELSGDGSIARASDAGPKIAVVEEAIDHTRQRVENVEAAVLKLHRHVSNVAVGADAMLRDVKDTVHRLGIEVTDVKRSTGEPETLPRQLPAPEEPGNEQLAQQVWDMRDALDKVLQEIREEREAQDAVATRTRAWQVVASNNNEAVVARVSALERSVDRLDGEVRHMLAVKESNVSPVLSSIVEMEQSSPLRDNESTSDLEGYMRRLSAVEAALQRLMFEVDGESFPATEMSNGSLQEGARAFGMELPSDSVDTQECCMVRLATVEKAVQQLVYEVIGGTPAPQEVPSIPLQEASDPSPLQALVEEERVARLDLEVRLRKVMCFVGCDDADAVRTML